MLKRRHRRHRGERRERGRGEARPGVPSGCSAVTTRHPGRVAAEGLLEGGDVVCRESLVHVPRSSVVRAVPIPCGSSSVSDALAHDVRYARSDRGRSGRERSVDWPRHDPDRRPPRRPAPPGPSWRARPAGDRRCRRRRRAAAAALIDDVRERGEAALLDQAERFDGVRPDAGARPRAGRSAPPSAASTPRSAPRSKRRSSGCAGRARRRSPPAASRPWRDGAEVVQRWQPVGRVGPLRSRRQGRLPVERRDERRAGAGRRRRIGRARLARRSGSSAAPCTR